MSATRKMTAPAATASPAPVGVMRGYARVSTVDQHPEVQIERLIAAGIAAGQIYVDKGQSGSKAKRPAWDRLMNDMEPGDKIAAVRLDRIGRSVKNLYDTMELFRSRGCYLWILDQGIDTEQPTGMGKLFFGILAVIAEFERDLIIERTVDAQAVVRLTGNMRRIAGGGPPLGFRDPGGAPDRDWVLDPRAADWLASGARMVLDDPQHRVETAFKALPPMTDSTGTPVNVKMFRSALKRAASAGIITVRDVEIGLAECGGPLDEQTWKRLKGIFAARSRGRTPSLVYYPFGPLLRCAKCGNTLTGEIGYKGRRMYGCRSPRKVNGTMLTPCRGVSVSAAAVEELLRVTVEEWLRSPAARAAAAEAPRASGRREELEELIADQQDMIAEFAAQRLARHMRAEKCAELSGEAAAMIDAARRELDELDALEDDGGQLPAGEGWDDMTVPERLRAVQRAVVTPIRVLPGTPGPKAVPTDERLLIIPR
ncbi:MAG TPA: recombinase family protein [Trebonia sp.]|jgi:DNA invertase Pin-like site-specific DNA recombinase|nr:recombinase family protein [Trebonia sp.]